MQKSLGELPYFIKHYRVDMSEFVVSIIISLFFILMLIISARKIPSFVQFNWTIIGAITYPLYLLHQNIGYMIFNAYFDRINPHMLFWGTLFMAIGTSFLVHVLIERKVSNALRSFMLGSIKRI
jgi:peptidoglycan/LPS O-acetylase OafA/YrhL